MITQGEIDLAKLRTIYRRVPHHGHPDRVRLAYEWFDAQKELKGAPQTWRPIRHFIQHWAGCCVDEADIEVAATLHAKVWGKYPNYNISMRLIRPNERRFNGIGEALKQSQYRDEYPNDFYATDEA